MKIDGKQIASEIKLELINQVNALKTRNVTPHLAVILVGDDPSSLSYIKQKQKVASEIGAKITLHQLLPSTQFAKLVKLVKSLNEDSQIHGIIIQRPVSLSIDKDDLDNLVSPQKDVDGFHSQSKFNPPISLAVLEIFDSVYNLNFNMRVTGGGEPRGQGPLAGGHGAADWQDPQIKIKSDLISWLKTKNILIIGRGETGGKPIAQTFRKLGIPFKIAHSSTPENELKNLCLDADMVISCVGKPNIVRHDMVSNNTILIGVGLHLENGKLKPDYKEEEIATKTAFYTPVPGGVGPVNVACLFENLIKTALLSSSRK